MEAENKKTSLTPVIILVLIISFFIGGLSGGFFGYFLNQGKVGNWIKENIFREETNSQSFANVNTSTLSVTENSATIDVVNKVKNAVVSIVGTKDYSKYYQNQQYSPFEYFFGYPSQLPQGETEVSGGTGFIIASDGLILTNKHVVADTTTEYSVVLNDGTKYDAEVLAKDPTQDLAFLKIEASNLTTVELGDSEALQIGQTVIAIGNALGEYRNTVTQGIVSGLARTIEAGSSTSGTTETLENTIQTDAAINYGNSGGPLLNLAGQVVGVNTAISSSGQLVGFAIPINEAKKDIESIQKSGKITRPYLGVRYILVNDQIKKADNLSVSYGALLAKGDASESAVMSGSPADKAGLEENDILLTFDGTKIDSDNSLAELITKKSPGDVVTLKVLHDGQEKEVKVTLEEWSGE
ncbi:MAG: trypsin-like peptidase domain-containing protein [Patescibacteria group bacterium]